MDTSSHVGMSSLPYGVAKIQDYGVIGDCRSAALISRSASIDWLCWPRFDSPSVFAALIDQGKGGRLSINPTEKGSISRRYLKDSNVLETCFLVAGGELE